MTNRWRRVALTTAATTAGTMLFFTGTATAEPVGTPTAGAGVSAADEPAPSGFETRIETPFMPAQMKTGVEVELRSQIFGVAANKIVNGGTAQFLVDGVPVGAPFNVTGNGLANYKHTFTKTGPNTVTVQYLGGGRIHPSTELAAPSTASVTVDVTDQDVATATTLTLPAIAETGVKASFTAQVDLEAGGLLPVRTGAKVQLFDNGVPIGAEATVSSDGKARLSHTFLTSGPREITAKFLGNNGFAASTSTIAVLDVAHRDLDTSTTLVVPNNGKAGQPVSLNAVVSPSIATGTVQFMSGETPVGNPVPVVDGAAALQHIFPEEGTHSITAVFSGTGFATSTSTPAPLSISAPAPGDTTTAVTAPAATLPAIPVTFTANVTPAPYGGTVQFYVGDTPVGDAVPVVNGFATTTHTFAATGTYQVSARYSGHIAANPSSSIATAVTVAGIGGGDGDTGSLGSLSLPFGS
ncbi:Ig-like domain-containing protein [Prescottella defluvii]|uniref:Ig-like domain-containing protein n=1 Tax=Prescottella defluvii TaxID=1323361 RepID=UPI0004F3B44E|nr:Ig-like domain-containing protein [Prescottella defluvii]